MNIYLYVTGNDYNDFLEDLEDDPELRKNVNLYKKEQWMAEAEEVLAPRVGLEELLDELDLDAADTDEQGNMLAEDGAGDS